MKKVPRRTITVEDFIHQVIQSIRGRIIEDTHKDFSYTTTVNMILLAGLIGASKFDDKDWGVIRSFLEDKRTGLEFAAIEDKIAAELLKRLKR